MKTFAGIVFLLLSISANAGQASLSWTPPTQNTDGTKLTDLAGYRIHHGAAKDSLSQTISISNPGITVYIAEDLPEGPWYAAVLAYNSAGVESDLSNVVSKTITAGLPPAPKILLTVGGDVWVATPNYTGPWPANGWKLGPKVGTIAAKIKCDASRRIGADYYIVKGPVIWTAGRKDYVVAKCKGT